MHLQVLGSGSEGNSSLIRAGDLTVLCDAGLGVRTLSERFEQTGVGPRSIDHLLVTHGHLDHARSAGAIAKRQRAVLHCGEAIMGNRAIARAPVMESLRIGSPKEIFPEHGTGQLTFTPVLLPHDCDPTVAFRFEHEGRKLVMLTDLGTPRKELAGPLREAHVLYLEFNYDPRMMAEGPYPPVLQRRITGGRGHLSNEQAATLLELLAGPDLHTLVIAHVSKKTNEPELAREVAARTLARLGLDEVRILVAEQDRIGENLRV